MRSRSYQLARVAMLAFDTFFLSLGRTFHRVRGNGKQQRLVRQQSLERLNRLLEG
jgi:hypothetical protein